MAARMAPKWLLVVGLIVQLRWSSAATLKQVIEGRTELKQVATLLEKVEMFSLGLNTGPGATRYTVFMPVNSAFNKSSMPTGVLNFFKSTSKTTEDKLLEILKYNTIMSLSGLTLKTTGMSEDIPVEPMNPQTHLFFKKIPGLGDFVNGARIIEGNIQATNGILHIVDSFLWDVGRTGRALKYIEDSAEREDKHFDSYFPDFGVNKFRELLRENERLEEEANNRAHVTYRLGFTKRLTMFVPSDEAIMRIDTNDFQALKRNSDQLKRVVESHLVIDEVFHTGLLERKLNDQIGALEGNIVPRKFKDDFYISNNCAQGKIIRSNITVSNGVIHIIDGLLGYVYYDIYSIVEKDSDLRRFYTHMFSTPRLKEELKMKDLTQEADVDSLYTVFAPINAAWANKDFTQDVFKLTQTMEMHVVRGLVNIADMKDGKSLPTLRDGYRVFFRHDKDDVVVDVDHVWGKIIEGDICVKNGIIHKIDGVLGTAVENMWAYVSNRDDLSEAYYVMRNLGLDMYVKDESKRITFFVPTDLAFAQMRRTQRGQTLLDSRNRNILRNVMYRHLVNDILTLRDIPREYDVRAEFGRFTVERSANGSYTIPFGQFMVHVRESDIKMINGVVHVIDHVIYSEDPDVDEYAGDATRWTVSVAAMTISLCLTFVSS